MRPFKSVAIVKCPIEFVWNTVRDRLSELVPLMEDMESITQLSREEQADGIVCLDNLWQARPLPLLRQSPHIKPEMFAWVDHAEWHPQSHTCRWRIESKFLPDALQCQGVTSYELAIGGRGTRVTFEGQLGLKSAGLEGIPFLDASLLNTFEMLASSVIPKNMRKLTEAVEAFSAEHNR
jgi:hypothetical protein